MFKRLAILSAAFMTVLAGLVPYAVLAQNGVPVKVVATREYAQGLDRVFEFDLANAIGKDVTVRGRVVLLNVYDASLPVTLPVKDVTVTASKTETIGVRWTDAPLIGQVRALLVLNDGRDPSLVQTFTFWVFPIQQAVMFIGVAAMALAIVIGALRLPKFLKERVPANMFAYAAEDDDSVVTLSNRFDVTWQDIVRANKLKPPYELKPGQRILIPKHGLRRPEAKV